MMESIRKWFYRPKVNTSRALPCSPICLRSAPSLVRFPRHPSARYTFVIFILAASLSLSTFLYVPISLSLSSLRAFRILAALYFLNNVIFLLIRYFDLLSTYVSLKFMPCPVSNVLYYHRIDFIFSFFRLPAPSCRSKACALFPSSCSHRDRLSERCCHLFRENFARHEVHTYDGISRVCVCAASCKHARCPINSWLSRNPFVRTVSARRIGKQYKYSMVFSVKVDSPKFIRFEI